MEPDTKIKPNVKQVVPFLSVSEMEASLRFYVEGLGCEMMKKWEVDGKIRWCWLEIGDAAVMLQEFRNADHDSWMPEGKVGEGVSICFVCEDALAIFHQARSRGIEASKPFVGNGMWVTTMFDPDGYRLDFESLTDAPEDTVYSEHEN